VAAIDQEWFAASGAMVPASVTTAAAGQQRRPCRSGGRGDRHLPGRELVERAMSGRAGFNLLRKRILLTP